MTAGGEIWVPVDTVEGHEQRRRGHARGLAVPEPLEAGDELVVEEAHLAVQDQRGRRQAADRRHERGNRLA
jgi:hypothetical protein